MTSTLALALVILAMVSGCATSRPAQTELGNEPATSNDPNAKIICPKGANKRIAAEFYRDLDPDWEPGRYPSPPGFKAPEFLQPPQVVYPMNILGMVKPGFVSVVVRIDTDGAVGSPQVVCSSDVSFEPAALEAVRTARFRPATLHGNAVMEIAIVPFEFLAKRPR